MGGRRDGARGFGGGGSVSRSVGGGARRSWGRRESGDGGWGEGRELRGYGSRRGSRHGGFGGCRCEGWYGSRGGRGRQWREVERLSGVDSVVAVVIHAVGSSDGVDAHTETQRKRIESVTWLHNIHDPAEGRAAGIGSWSRAGVEGRWQIDLLFRIDGRCAQAVGLHQRKRGKANPQGKASERVSSLHGVHNPAPGLRTTGYQR